VEIHDEHHAGGAVTDASNSYGIDLLIPLDVSLEQLVAALEAVAAIPRAAIVQPGDDDAARGLAIYGYPVWAAIHAYPAGDIAWKADLGSKVPRDHVAIGRLIAQKLATAIIWPDDATLAPNAALRCAPDGATTSVTLVDIEMDDGALAGFEVREPLADSTPIKTATKHSWTSIVLIDGQALPYHATFSAREFERIKRGLIPHAMEDKWFIYYEAPHLHLHRSWTGQGVYRLAFNETLDGAQSIEVVCAEEVLGRSTVAYQTRLLHWLIHNLLLGANEPFPLPSEESGLDGVLQHHIAGTGYAETEPTNARRRWWSRWFGKT
jgi:hypothetical protein